MNVLKKLESVQANKPYHGFTQLKKGSHEILNFRYVKNKFGKKSDGSNKNILVELNDEVLFLPQYFQQKLNSEDICEMNESISSNVKIYLHFGGKVKGEGNK